jgi:hypothetical protein
MGKQRANFSRRAFLGAAVASSSLIAGADGLPRQLLAPGQENFSSSFGDKKLLFVDDHHVLYRSGTHRIFHPLQRYAKNPVLRGAEKAWEAAIAYNSVYRDPKSGKYQMWYQSYAGPAARDKQDSCTICYAESADGIEWSKPSLGIYPFNDIRDTNIVLLANGGRSDRYGASVIVDANESDPQRRYKSVYFDFTTSGGRNRPGLSLAFSPDGIHWTKYPQAPLMLAAYGDRGDEVPFSDQPDKDDLIPLSIADAFDLMYDPRAQVFGIYGKMWIDGPDGRMFWKHAAHRATSKDLVHWGPPTVCLVPDDDDPAWVEFHTTPVFYYAGVYFAAPQILNRALHGGVMDVELAISRDGMQFSRPFRKTYWLPKGTAGEFDGGTVVTNATPVILEDEIRIYYGGYSTGATGADDTKLISGIGMASLRRDRFAGLSATTNVGQVTLKPIELTGIKELRLNCDSGTGSVRIELLDERGYRVRGFSREEAVPLRGDNLRHAAAWKNQSVANLKPGRYMPRLHLEGNAEVFAVELM